MHRRFFLHSCCGCGSKTGPNPTDRARPDGSTKLLSPSASTSFTELEAGYVLETFIKGSKSYFEVYHDGNGDGVYTSIAHGSGTTIDLVGLKAQIDATVDALT